jgi:cell division septal protein FtsQ
VNPTATLPVGSRPIPVDPRIQARREQVERSRHRRRRRRLLAAAAVILVVAGAWAATRTALLDVDEVVVAGADRTDPDEVRARAAIGPGDQLFDVDAGAVRQRVRELPWVADAAVRVRWNGVVEVEVYESAPFATVAVPGGEALLDQGGRVLAVEEQAPPGLVRIEGVVVPAPGDSVEDPAGVLRVAAALGPGLRSRVDTVIATPEGQIDLRVRPQGTVWLGRVPDLDEQLRGLTTVFARVDDLDVLVYDARVPGQVAVTRLPPAEKPADETSGAPMDEMATGG